MTEIPAGPNTDAPPAARTPPVLRASRPREEQRADEVTMARGWLNHLRESAILKAEGLDHDQLRWTPTPTANSIGALLRHLGLAERLWLRVVFTGEITDTSFLETMFDLPDNWTTPDTLAFTGRRSPPPTPCSTPRRRSMSHPGSIGRPPRCAGSCSTSSKRAPATLATSTSHGNSSTAPPAGETGDQR